MKNNYCVYLHINPKTKEVFYVGQGLPKRPYDFYMDSSYSNRNECWCNTVKLFGNPDVEVILKDITKEESLYYEENWTNFFGLENLCNRKSGAKLTPEQIQQRRESWTINNPNNNPEVIQKKRDALTGKPKSAEHIANNVAAHEKAIIQLDAKSGCFIAEWESQSKAGRSLGIKQGDINNCLKGRQHTAKGYIWKYKEGDV